MSLLGEQTVTRRRYADGSWSGGRFTPGAATDTTFQGSVQPLGGKDRQVLPEGVRQRDGRKVYCPRSTLRVEDQHAQTAGDEVLIGGVAFVVMHVDSDHPLIEHDRAFVVRPPEGE